MLTGNIGKRKATQWRKSEMLILAICDLFAEFCVCVFDED